MKSKPIPRRLASKLAAVSVVVTFSGGAPPTDFTIRTTADAGPGPLRQVILDANAAAGADRILFAVPGARALHHPAT